MSMLSALNPDTTITPTETLPFEKVPQIDKERAKLNPFLEQVEKLNGLTPEDAYGVLRDQYAAQENHPYRELKELPAGGIIPLGEQGPQGEELRTLRKSSTPGSSTLYHKRYGLNREAKPFLISVEQVQGFTRLTSDREVGYFRDKNGTTHVLQASYIIRENGTVSREVAYRKYEPGTRI